MMVKGNTREHNAPPRGESQTRRRIKYGLNVTAAVAIALALVVLVNWIAYDKFGRWDLTATGRHSLSPQTMQILAQVDEDLHIVALFNDGHPDPTVRRMLMDTRDLLEEYGRRSAHVRVEQIDPNRDITRRDRFYEQLKAHFANDLAPLGQAVEQGMAGMDRTIEVVGMLLGQLRQTLDDPQLTNTTVRRDLEAVMAAFGGDDSTLTARRDELREALDMPLPAYDQVRLVLHSGFEQLHNTLPHAIARFQRSVDAQGVPMQVQNALLGYARDLQRLQGELDQWKRAIADAPTATRYADAVDQLRHSQAIAVISAKQVRVIPVEQMFRAPEAEHVQQRGTPDLRFMGEERLTGALLSMNLPEPPLVVFVATGQQTALGDRGSMQYVAERLRRANFEVQQWNPSGQFTMTGEPAPARPAPRPRANQRAVWVILASPPVNPNDPRTMMAGDNRPDVAELLERRLEQGDGAIVMLAANPHAITVGADPVAELIARWGIQAQLDRQILREVQIDDRRSQPTSVMPVTRWPGEHGIGFAVAGLAGVFTQSSPLELDAQAMPGVEHHPLVELRQPRMWAERDLQGYRTRELRYDPALGDESYITAVAAEAQGRRLVVVADPIWAYDDITTISRAGGRGSQIDFEGAMYPGNSELFVNSVYWLAGLDEMIAASPRTQDIRSIGEISERARRTTNWLLIVAMPGMIGLAGVGVWLVRRRS